MMSDNHPFSRRDFKQLIRLTASSSQPLFNLPDTIPFRTPRTTVSPRSTTQDGFYFTTTNESSSIFRTLSKAKKEEFGPNYGLVPPSGQRNQSESPRIPEFDLFGELFRKSSVQKIVPVKVIDKRERTKSQVAQNEKMMKPKEPKMKRKWLVYPETSSSQTLYMRKQLNSLRSEYWNKELSFEFSKKKADVHPESPKEKERKSSEEPTRKLRVGSEDQFKEALSPRMTEDQLNGTLVKKPKETIESIGILDQIRSNLLNTKRKTTMMSLENFFDSIGFKRNERNRKKSIDCSSGMKSSASIRVISTKGDQIWGENDALSAKVGLSSLGKLFIVFTKAEKTKKVLVEDFINEFHEAFEQMVAKDRHQSSLLGCMKLLSQKYCALNELLFLFGHAKMLRAPSIKEISEFLFEKIHKKLRNRKGRMEISSLLMNVKFMMKEMKKIMEEKTKEEHQNLKKEMREMEQKNKERLKVQVAFQEKAKSEYFPFGNDMKRNKSSETFQSSEEESRKLGRMSSRTLRNTSKFESYEDFSSFELGGVGPCGRRKETDDSIMVEEKREVGRMVGKERREETMMKLNLNENPLFSVRMRGASLKQVETLGSDKGISIQLPEIAGSVQSGRSQIQRKNSKGENNNSEYENQPKRKSQFIFSEYNSRLSLGQETKRGSGDQTERVPFIIINHDEQSEREELNDIPLVIVSNDNLGKSQQDSELQRKRSMDDFCLNRSLKQESKEGLKQELKEEFKKARVQIKRKSKRRVSGGTMARDIFEILEKNKRKNEARSQKIREISEGVETGKKVSRLTDYYRERLGELC